MRDNYFWRLVAVIAVLSVFYLGHGLHNGGNDGLPSLSQTAHASGIMARDKENAIFTTSPDGKTVYVWHQAGPYKLEFASSAQAK